MPLKNRVTQQDVALRAGVHRTAVSLALKKHPSIPAETRERIEAVAAEMGYVPDPMLSALAAYRGSRRTAAFHGTLAWLVNSSNGYNWKKWALYRDYHAGVVRAAERYGYKVEVFDLGPTGMTASRISRLLHARTISGLLLCPQPRARMEMDFPWEKFSAVTFGYTLERPHLHTVTATQYRNVTLTVRELLRRGYRRIGFVFHNPHDARTDHNFLGGYLAERQFMAAQLEPLLVTNYPDYAEELKKWLKKQRPDAIIAGGSDVVKNLARLGLQVPADIGVACPCLMDSKSTMSGVFEDPVHTGEVSVDVLVAMMQRNERGVPERSQRIHVEGVWSEGTTLRVGL